MKQINFKQDERLSFDQMKEKYELTIEEVMQQFYEWRASL